MNTVLAIELLVAVVVIKLVLASLRLTEHLLPTQVTKNTAIGSALSALARRAELVTELGETVHTLAKVYILLSRPLLDLLFRAPLPIALLTGLRVAELPVPRARIRLAPVGVGLLRLTLVVLKAVVLTFEFFKALARLTEIVLPLMVLLDSAIDATILAVDRFTEFTVPLLLAGIGSAVFERVWLVPVGVVTNCARFTTTCKTLL